MKKIFISYSRKDLDFVDKFAEDLQQAGYDVWYDLTDLEGGDHWADELQAAIDESDVYVLVISPNSVDSEWVEKEFIYADSKDKRIVPVFYEQTDLPLWLINIHYVDIQGRKYKENFPQILEAFDDDGKPAAPVHRTAKGTRGLSPTLIGGIIGGVVLILAAIFGLPALLGGPDSTPTVTATEASVAPTPASATETSEPTSTPVGDTSTPEPLLPEITDAKGAEMILIPAGSFTMGSEAGEADERPIHVIGMDDYYLDKYEVTNAQYKECVDALVCDLPASTRLYTDARFSDHPVVFVSWDMAVTFCEWRGARLPTEAEWEKAARGVALLSYPWGNDFDGTLLNYCDLNCTYAGADRGFNDRYATTAPVGSYENGVSPYGIYDLAGNAMEWVSDWYSENYYNDSPQTNPPGPNGGTYRVLRGGSWLDTKDNVRSFKRIDLDPNNSYNYIGFRCAVNPNP